MIVVIIDDKIIETGYYKEPVVHNIYQEDRLYCSIRKANIENYQESISVLEEYVEEEFFTLNLKR